MPTPPKITVQIIHIEGPLKGQIQEFVKAEITLGRYPSCDVRFPAECGTISRKHATLTREGNQFLLNDNSANGTFVNGKKIDQVVLKDGDVITIAPNGPKISFLTIIEDSSMILKTEATVPPAMQKAASTKQPDAMGTPPPRSAPVAAVKVSCIIQYGPKLDTFDELPIDLGKAGGCAFTIDHPDLKERHAQIYYSNGAYWIKDLTGLKLVRIGASEVESGMALNTNDEISLTPNGPFLIYLGNGRFAELEQ